MNNTTHTEEEMIEFYKNVPDNIRVLLLDDNFGPAIQVIGRENGLTPTQSLEAEDVVTLILLGVEPLSQFNQLLQEKLEIPREKVREITKSIGENIFSPIKESLEKIQTHEEKTIPKNTFIPAPVKNTEVSSSVIKPIPPLTLSISPKTIIGAEKIGIDIPSKKTGGHPFEKKLRTVIQQQEEATTLSEDKGVNKESSSVNNKEPLIPKPPTEKKQEEIDPYRELAE